MNTRTCLRDTRARSRRTSAFKEIIEIADDKPGDYIMTADGKRVRPISPDVKGPGPQPIARSAPSPSSWPPAGSREQRPPRFGAAATCKCG